MLGLDNNMVYDIIPEVSSVVGTTVVNASVYTVDCMALHKARQVDMISIPTPSRPDQTTPQYVFELEESIQAAMTLPCT